MKIQMQGDYILVKPIEEVAKVTSSGIILSGNVVPPCEGTVVSAGPGKMSDRGQFIENIISVNDVVIFGPASKNKPLEEDGITYYVMQADEVFGKRR